MGQGLYHSTDAGLRFSKIPCVATVDFMAIGKAATKLSYPAIYILGTLDGKADKQLYRSIDEGKSWKSLGVPAIGKTPRCMAADRRVYGRVYLGTGGNGFFYSTENN